MCGNDLSTPNQGVSFQQIVMNQIMQKKIQLKNYERLTQNDIQILHLVNTSELKQINLQKCLISSKHLKVLMDTNMPQLQNLNLSHNKIKKKDCLLISISSNIPKLRTLQLNDNLVYDQGLNSLLQLQLEDLSLNNCNLTYQGCQKLKQMSTLRYLSLGGNNLPNQISKIIPNLNKLIFLKLSRNKITDEGFNQIINLPFNSLQVLLIDRNKITVPKNTLQKTQFYIFY